MLVSDDPMSSNGTRDWFERDAQDRQRLRQRVLDLSVSAERLKAVLAMALEQSPHPDDCGVKRQQDCTCWRDEARRLLAQ